MLPPGDLPGRASRAEGDPTVRATSRSQSPNVLAPVSRHDRHLDAGSSDRFLAHARPSPRQGILVAPLPPAPPDSRTSSHKG